MALYPKNTGTSKNVIRPVTNSKADNAVAFRKLSEKKSHSMKDAAARKALEKI